MNKYKGIRVEEAGEEQPLSIHHAQLDLGLRGDLKPRQLPPGSSPAMLNVRFERGGFRRDFGEHFMGQQAIGRILNLIEHKFIDIGVSGPDLYGEDYMYGGDTALAQFVRLVRFFRDLDGRATTEIWNAATQQWVGDTKSVIIEERYVRAVSVQNILLYAVKGSSILIRREAAELQAGSNSFPSGNKLEAPGDLTFAVFDSSELIFGNQFSVNFQAHIGVSQPARVTMVVAVIVDGEEVGTRVITTDDGGSASRSFNLQSITFQRFLPNPTQVFLTIKSIEVVAANTTPASTPMSPGSSGEPAYVTGAFGSNLPQDDKFTVKWDTTFDVSENESIIYTDWLIYHYQVSTGIWAELGTLGAQKGIVEKGDFFFSPGQYNREQSHTLVIPNFAEGDRIGIVLDKQSVRQGFGQLISWAGDEVEWQVPEDITYEAWVKGYNLVDDFSSIIPARAINNPDGLTYQELLGVESSMEVSDGPEALWIEPFANRVVALVDAANTQSLWWTPSGAVDNWDPFVPGAGQINLIDSRNDPIDDLQCAAPLSSDTLAIFRSRSIMRGFRTGRIEQAIGVQHWLENIGTESPFSRQITPIGVIFLGHDLMVYVLTESGIKPVGMPIHQELVEQLTARLEIVDAMFDPVLQHYYMAIPVQGSSICCMMYILDVAKLMHEDRIVWRKRSVELERFGLASQV